MDGLLNLLAIVWALGCFFYAVFVGSSKGDCLGVSRLLRPAVLR